MFRELDQRQSDWATVTLEWDAATGEVQVRCEDRHSPDESFSYLVDPDHAQLAFMHPSALRPSSEALGQPASDHGETNGDGAKRRRGWFRQRTEAEAIEQPDRETWIWWLP